METLVKEICRQEQIVLKSVIPLKGGQLNQVFLVNGTYVIRIGVGEVASLRLQKETALLQSLAGEICVPTVYAFGRYRDCGYQIQGYIHGQKLHWVWRSLKPEQKEKIIKELAQELRLLHLRTSTQFGVIAEENRRYNTWREFHEDHLKTTLEELKAWRVKFEPAILELVEERFERDKEVLSDGMPCLIHRDLWLGNILVEGGKLTAILDFELATYAPLDYELLLVEEFCLYPNDYAEQGNEVYKATDFADFPMMLSEHAPEIFACPNLRKRLDLYHLIYALSAYLRWRTAQTIDHKETFLVQPSTKILNFLFEHGARMI